MWLMKTTTILLALLTIAAPSFAKVDQRLATGTKVYVKAADPLADDRPVTACFELHLPDALPLTVAAEDEADYTIEVTANIVGAKAQAWGSLIGGAASVSLGSITVVASTPAGQFWKGSERVDATSSDSKRSVADKQCALADAGINMLRNAMRKARDKK